MTSLDCHINRMCTKGFISEVAETPFIYSHNISMYALEQGFYNQLRFNPDNLNYLFQNERLISTVYCPRTKDEYYIVQISDKDINLIINWGEGDYLQQGQRFGQIRWGSQVDICLPLSKESKINYEILVEPFMHIKAGMDKIIKIIK